ncbi:MAG: rhomboid family intramembrane serine protease [Phycisphaerae bacterium]|nr:rhomboid family intramembrane serine protease [Phycisphaerae bacterium]
MFIPIRTDYRMTRTPWVNYLLVAINVAAFVVSYRWMLSTGATPVTHLLLDPDNPRLYQFFTSIFLHGSIMHIVGNMVFLWVFGNAVNDRLGHAGYLAFYLGGGVLAGVGYILLGGHYPVLGASGAISAVTGAYLVLLPRARVTLLMWLFYFLTTIEVSSLYFLMFQFAFNLWMSLDARFGGAASSGVAYAAHGSGYVFGIAVTAALLATRLLPRDPMDLLNLVRAARRRAHYRRMVQTGYDPFNPVGSQIADPQRRWVDAKTTAAAPPDTPEARELHLRREIAEAWSRHDLPEAAGKYLQLIQVAEGAVLPQDQQLDVANQLMAVEQYPAAADAYERFVNQYGAYEHIADIHLMLGLLYGRYLHQDAQAERLLRLALDSLKDERKRQLAREDLEALRQRR